MKLTTYETMADLREIDRHGRQGTGNGTEQWVDPANGSAMTLIERAEEQEAVGDDGYRRIRNHIVFFSGAAKAGEIAAQRQASAIVDIHACARERRAWRARLVDVVVADVNPDVHLENA